MKKLHRINTRIATRRLFKRKKSSAEMALVSYRWRNDTFVFIFKHLFSFYLHLTYCNSQGIWTELTSLGGERWTGIAVSSDGLKIFAAASTASSSLYTSTDGGITWVEHDGQETGGDYWNCVASSADGMKLIAGADYDYLRTSSDGGATWTQQTSSGSKTWYSLASSADGMRLIAGPDGGYLSSSSDGGITWTVLYSTFGTDWTNTASSSDGMKLFIAPSYGYLYTSTDGGVSWVTQNGAGERYWGGIASSSDGMKLLAAGYNGNYIYTSTDGGYTWITQTSAGKRDWIASASSADGMKLIVANDYGYLYTSSDGGYTWVEQTSAGSREWTSVAASADGMKLYAGCIGYIYASSGDVYNNTSPPTLVPTFAPSKFPTRSPTWFPTRNPTQAPTAPSRSPTFCPSTFPSRSPTFSPSKSPTIGSPTRSPTESPTKSPTRKPTAEKTKSPTLPTGELPQSLCTEGTYYDDNSHACQDCPSYQTNSESGSLTCDNFQLNYQLFAQIIGLGTLVLLLLFVILIPKINFLRKIVYFYILFIPAFDFISDVLYLFTQKFYNIQLFVICSCFILIPLIPFIKELHYLQVRPGLHSSTLNFLTSMYLWLSNIDGYPAIYGQRITGIFVFQTHDNILKLFIYFLVWLLAITLQAVCYLPIIFTSFFFIILYIPLILFGYILFQTKLMCINYIWNRWIRIFCNQQDAEKLYRSESPDVINLELFNKAIVYEITMETFPQLIIQLINNYLMKNFSGLLIIISFVTSALMTFNGLWKMIYWNLWKGVAFADIPISLLFGQYRIQNNYQGHEDDQKRIIGEIEQRESNFSPSGDVESSQVVLPAKF